MAHTGHHMTWDNLAQVATAWIHDYMHARKAADLQSRRMAAHKHALRRGMQFARGVRLIRAIEVQLRCRACPPIAVRSNRCCAARLAARCAVAGCAR